MARIPGKHFLRNLIHSRTLLVQLVRRDFQQRFVGSIAGWVWALIHPLVLLASWTFVFQICLRQALPPAEVTQNYTIFLFCGFLPWLLFQDTVMRSSTSLLENANLITKTVFPSEIIPISIFFSSLISHLLALALLVTVVGVWIGHLSLMSFTLPVYMALLGLFAVGIGWIVAGLQVYLRDTSHLLSVIMTFWFWMTPIFISEEQIPEQVRFLVRINPMAYIVTAYRERLLSYRLPALEQSLILCACALGAFVLGGLVFRHLKRGFADVL
ncbi:MAG: ABC transporter permease [Acidobacteria bacterium]|nr:ABC transporter permease [Acidobacteriota bacterium]MBI3278705.1 ABC transporter permease [Acidobacteriota bacterium]